LVFEGGPPAGCYHDSTTRAWYGAGGSPAAKGNVLKLVTRNDRWTLLFIALGYLGAATFYSYIIGINANRQIFCLVCPHIFSPASPPVPLFFQRTLVIGTLKAAFLLVVGWTIIFLVRRTKRIFIKRRSE
jgi:hypothetical protein